ncbi:sulfite exporter TauE/SafE family protein [Actinomyces sp. 2119]|uniref:sulfite exporter TauE/SafE family protein n=1 Tax=Actinomyces sp. 2119 TaxID=2321393 RepID=UPI000E6B7F39|nr:sulfite exporter TauE/SafE family protein [Actinomyces sp. 2119]RJF44723.1 sulfite exporter TauE/SafE family protein [Actinomyces sp. 2119]
MRGGTGTTETGRNEGRGGVAVPGRLPMVLVGLAAGLLSGLFGVGGGVLLVPALVAVLGLDHRRAAATSLVAILPTSVVGALTYGLRGQVSLVAAVILLAGTLVGAQVGAWLLHRLPARVLPWTFASFVVLVLVSQQVVPPVRHADLTLDPVRVVALVVVGLAAGVLSGLVGVGGGVVVVPGLEAVVGLGDLLARGTSLAVMVPTAVSGAVAHLRRGHADLATAVVTGLASSAASPVGALLAAHVPPGPTSWMFSAFLVVVAVLVLRRSPGRSTASR